MHLTRRGWAAAGCALALAVGSVLLGMSALLFGTAGVGAVLLGSQVAFARALANESDGLEIDVDIDPESPAAGEQVTLTLRCRRERPSLWLRVVLSPSATLLSESLSLDLGRSATGTATAQTTPSVAGTYTPGSARLVATDHTGLFYATAPVAVDETVRVRPDASAVPSVDIDGRRAAGSLGEHGGDRSGSGIEPLHLRAYSGAAPLGRIDWKATARLDDVYVTESEADSDRQTVLLLDHGAPSTGEAATPLAALRHAALTVVEWSRALGDPVGLYAVGEEGITAVDHPDSTPEQYRHVATRIEDIQATGERARTTSAVGGYTRAGAGDTLQAASTLADADGQFATTLGPFLADATPYLHRVEDDPLLSTAENYLPRVRGPTWTVVLTDDRNRGELRRTVDIARRGGGRVLVVVAPLARFEADSSEHAEAATFRRELNEIVRVDALLVGPDGTLGTDIGRERR